MCIAREAPSIISSVSVRISDPPAAGSQDAANKRKSAALAEQTRGCPQLLRGVPLVRLI
jgi:hypothetical protein